MKRKRIWFSALICIAAGSVFLQCTQCTPLTDTKLRREITLVSYNTQTFFDAVEDGTEFKEFKGDKSRWTEQKYRTRLERLKQTVLTAGERLSGKQEYLPDIVVLQEIENDRVVEDFCKQLPKRGTYPYAVCPSRSGRDAFTTVILSKYPIENYFIHRLHTEDKTALRPLIEVVLNTGTKDTPRLLTVFAVHWKSKSGGPKSASIRSMQETQLISKLQEHKSKNPQTPFIVCGDFNQPLEEFSRMDGLTACWNIADYQIETEAGTQPGGSYYFKGIWEKIDHIFYNSGDYGSTGMGTIEPKVFFVLYEPPLIAEGKPVRYNVLTGDGYSDHLPLGFRFEIRR